MRTTKDFAARFYAPPNCDEHHKIITATSRSKAQAHGKTIALENGWRLVEVFELKTDEEKSKFNLAGWYVNHITL